MDKQKAVQEMVDLLHIALSNGGFQNFGQTERAKKAIDAFISPETPTMQGQETADREAYEKEQT